MSLLDFLKIAAPAGGALRPRKLAIESLERRAVLTVLEPLLTNAVAETTALIEQTVTPIAEVTQTVTEPVTEDPPPPEEPIAQDPPPLEEPIAEDPSPIEEPITEDPPPEEPVDGGEAGGGEEEIVPQIVNAHHSRDGLWVAFSGFIQDDDLVEGLTVYFSTDLGHQFTATVAADGSFSTMPMLIELGTQVSIWTIDTDDNYSEYCLLIV